MYHENINYTILPNTQEEKSIASLLEKALEAVNRKDIDLLLSVFTENASIMPPFSQNKKTYLKKNYGRLLRAQPSLTGTFYFHDVKIRLSENKKEAKVYMLLEVRFERTRKNTSPSMPYKVRRYYYGLKKHNGWFFDLAIDA